MFTSEGLAVRLDVDGRLEQIDCLGQRFNGYTGKVQVIDELPDAEAGDVSVGEAWTSLGDCLSWKFTIRLRPGKAYRSVRLKARIPYPERQARLKVWTAHRRFPDDLCNIGGLHLRYGDVCHGTLIPAVALYEPQRNVGLTIAKAFGRVGGRLSFNFGDYHEAGMTVEFAHLALSDQRPVEIELLLRAHEGCWRPGLRWLRDRYPDYFEPPNPAVNRQRGAFAITNPFTEPDYLDRQPLKWVEVHNHFPHYGDYAPEADAWDSVVLHDYPDLAGEVPGPVTPARIRTHIADLHRRSIKAMLYFQCGGDGYIPWVQEHFPTAIARDCAGNMLPTWRECCFVSAASCTAYGQFVCDRIDRFIAMYPQIDGVFLDQLCYQTLDYAHSDGRTAVNNQPAAEYGPSSYEPTLEKLATKLHEQDKFVWANGPFDVEIAKYVDGIMSEGVGDLSQSFKYLCLRKPLLVHAYPTDAASAEVMLEHCLLAGASWSMGGSSTLRTPPQFDRDTQAVFAAYLPLIEPLLEADILLEADPFRAPPGWRGEMFESRDGKQQMLALAQARGSVLSGRAVTVGFKSKVLRAAYRGTRDTEWHNIEARGNQLDIPGDSNAYTILLTLRDSHD